MVRTPAREARARVDAMLAVLRNPRRRIADRLEAARWLADQGWGEVPASQEAEAVLHVPLSPAGPRTVGALARSLVRAHAPAIVEAVLKALRRGLTDPRSAALALETVARLTGGGAKAALVRLRRRCSDQQQNSKGS